MREGVPAHGLEVHEEGHCAGGQDLRVPRRVEPRLHARHREERGAEHLEVLLHCKVGLAAGVEDVGPDLPRELEREVLGLLRDAGRHELARHAEGVGEEPHGAAYHGLRVGRLRDPGRGLPCELRRADLQCCRLCGNCRLD